MKQFSNLSRRQLAWIGGGGAAIVLALPLAPSLTSAFATDSSSQSGSAVFTTVARAQIVASGTPAGPGLIKQPVAGITTFVSCPKGRAIGGGYAFPNGAIGRMSESAPADDNAAHWNFRSPDLMPVGTKLYVVCL